MKHLSSHRFCLGTYGLILMSSLKFSSALLWPRFSESFLSLVQVMWIFSGTTSLSSSSSEYKLSSLTIECLSFTS